MLLLRGGCLYEGLWWGGVGETERKGSELGGMHAEQNESGSAAKPELKRLPRKLLWDRL